MNYRAELLKKAGLIFAVLVFFLLLLAWIYGRSFIPKPPPEYLGVAMPKETASAIHLDSDNDGLKDWEETMYRTDPKNPDTDGDTTPDGDEIAKNRNPLKKGPGDENPIKIEEPDPIQHSYQKLKNLSEQGNITQALVYQVINQNGLDSFLNPNQSKQTVEELGTYLKNIKSLPEFSESAILDSSLTITSATDERAIKTYFNTVAEIYEKNILPLKEDDLTIFSQAVQSENREEIKKIDRLTGAIEKTKHEIIALLVPQSVLLLHKKEIFLLSHTVAQLKLMRDTPFDDALYVALIMHMRIDTKKKISELHNAEIPNWFASKNIIFSVGDKAPLLYQKR